MMESRDPNRSNAEKARSVLRYYGSDYEIDMRVENDMGLSRGPRDIYNIYYIDIY